VHSPVSSGRRWSCALVSSVGMHACLILLVVVFGAMSVSPTVERVLIFQEVLLGSPGGEGLPDGGPAGKTENPAQAVPQAAEQTASRPAPEAGRATLIKPKAKPSVSREKTRPVEVDSGQEPVSQASNSQVAAQGGAGQEVKGAGIATQGQGGHGKGSGQYEGEFGTGNGPRFARRVVAKYPVQARRFGKEGVVVMLLTIDESGRLKSVEIVEKAGSGFDDEALEAVKSSTYLPATLDGRAVPSRAKLKVRFQLAES